MPQVHRIENEKPKKDACMQPYPKEVTFKEFDYLEVKVSRFQEVAKVAPRLP